MRDDSDRHPSDGLVPDLDEVVIMTSWTTRQPTPSASLWPRTTSRTCCLKRA
jgi:hypothetical protein